MDPHGAVVEARLAAAGAVAEDVTRVALVGEHVARVVQDDIEDDIEPLRVRGIDQGTQFVVGLGRVVGEPGLGRDEIVDAITVIRRVEVQVLQHRA